MDSEIYLQANRYQELMHNNIKNNNILDNIDIIKKAIENGDNDLMKSFYNKVSNDHEIRVNLIKKIISVDYIIENNGKYSKIYRC